MSPIKAFGRQEVTLSTPYQQPPEVTSPTSGNVTSLSYRRYRRHLQ